VETQILGFITAFFVVLLATPSLIKVAKLKHLVDMPGDERKLHKRSVPTIGGIIIFSAILFSYALWFRDYTHFTPTTKADIAQMARDMSDFKYLIGILIILFFVGIKDDIIGTAPMKKLMAHIIVGFILVMMADMRITGMHGLFGIGKVFPEWASALLTMFVYIVIVNAFNLIDGVDGLAAGVGLICSITFGFLFYVSGDYAHSLLAFILAGALMGFLFFNFMPARIFMGDSGSLTIGAIISVLAIRLIELNPSKIPDELQGLSLPVVAMSIMAYPLVDTLRVFTVRASRGQSPFSADKNHLHHRLLKFGFNHAKTVFIIYLYNIAVIGMALCTAHLNSTISFLAAAGTALAFPAILFLIKPTKN
jgi:UDP-GlcNAc:undecaprenyl-phosphate GlcNAc-1-phosphate transferase